MSRTRIAVIGTGYVGLTTAVCLAHLGHDVHATDLDEDKIAALRAGESPLLEPGLDGLLAEGRRNGRLRFGTDNAAAAAWAELVFLCVQTPAGPDGHPDTRALEAAASQIGPVLAPGAVVVNKSTCPLGSNGRVGAMLGRGDVAVVTNPEFLREGSAISDFLHPDRVVVGSADPESARRVAELFAGLGGELIVTDPTSAELVKYAANAFLATKVTFANSLAALCEAFGANVQDVAPAVGADHRIGRHFLSPGPGFGGSCLPKDTSALTAAARDRGEPFRLLETVVEVNELQRQRIVDRVTEMAGGCLEGRSVAIWGLTFKAGTDDLRASPALDIAGRLRSAGAAVRAFDPVVGHRAGLEGLEVFPDRYSACAGAAVLLVATEWEELERSNWEKVAELMDRPRVLDARNLLDAAELARHGFEYAGIGVARVRPQAADRRECA